MNKARELRNRTGLTQAAFAEKFEIPKRTVENWEGEKSNPPGYVLKMLEKLIELDKE